MSVVLTGQDAVVSTFDDLGQPSPPAPAEHTPQAPTSEEVVSDTLDLSLEVVELEGVRIDLAGLSVSMKCEIIEGRYETAESSVCRKLIEPGESILELGGGIGFVGILCRRELNATRVVSLEPNAATLDRLRRNYALNTLDPTVIEAAVAAEDGVANLHVSSEFWLDSLISLAKLISPRRHCFIASRNCLVQLIVARAWRLRFAD